MKKLILSLSAVLLLSGCFGSDIIGSSIELNPYDGSFYTISHPSNWEVLTRDDKLKDSPADTVIVFRSNELQNGIYPNISIVQDRISEDLSSEEFAKINMEKAPLAIKNLQTVSKEEIDINGNKTILFSFLGRGQEQDRDMERFQIYFTKKDIGITVTAVCSPDSSDTLKTALKDALKSFQFK